jgi:hypothetical protein
LFKGDPLSTISKVLIGGVQGAAVFLSGFVVLIVIEHDFEQGANSGELGGGKLIEQGVGLLKILLNVESHESYFLSPPAQVKIAAGIDMGYEHRITSEGGEAFASRDCIAS